MQCSIVGVAAGFTVLAGYSLCRTTLQMCSLLSTSSPMPCRRLRSIVSIADCEK